MFVGPDSRVYLGLKDPNIQAVGVQVECGEPSDLPSGDMNAGDQEGGDVKGGAELTGVANDFAFLIYADKESGKLSWLDTGIVGQPGALPGYFPVQFDSDGGIYYAASISRSGEEKWRLVKKVGQDVTDVYTAEGQEEISFITTQVGIVYLLLSEPCKPKKLYAVDTNTLANSLVSDNVPLTQGRNSMEVDADGKLYFADADLQLKVYDPKTGTLSSLDLPDLPEASGCDEGFQTAGEHLFYGWRGKLVQIHPTVKEFADCAEVGPILSDGRIALLRHDSSNQIVLHDSATGDETPITLPDKQDLFIYAMSYQSSSDELILSGHYEVGMSLQGSPEKLKGGNDRQNILILYGVGSGDAKEADTEALLENLQAL